MVVTFRSHAVENNVECLALKWVRRTRVRLIGREDP